MFELTNIEKQSAVWKKLEGHLAERLDVYRQQNDKPTLTIAETNFLRGKIAALKELHCLGKPDKIKTMPPKQAA